MKIFRSGGVREEWSPNPLEKTAGVDEMPLNPLFEAVKDIQIKTAGENPFAKSEDKADDKPKDDAPKADDKPKDDAPKTEDKPKDDAPKTEDKPEVGGDEPVVSPVGGDLGGELAGDLGGGAGPVSGAASPLAVAVEAIDAAKAAVEDVAAAVGAVVGGVAGGTETPVGAPIDGASASPLGLDGAGAAGPVAPIDEVHIELDGAGDLGGAGGVGSPAPDLDIPGVVEEGASSELEKTTCAETIKWVKVADMSPKEKSKYKL